MVDSAELMVLCPSRGRPKEALETYESFLATRSDVRATHLKFVVDADDPTAEGYRELPTLFLRREATGNMVKALNSAALDIAPFYDIVGFIGDDHRFRTSGWDNTVIATLTATPGLAYGNDLAQMHRLPTQVFMNSKIILALGWMGLPTCRHLYIDNTWLILGEGTNLHYLPEVIIEHLHPAYGKGEWDEGHVRVNTREMYDHDAEAYRAWLKDQADEDIAKVRAAL